MADISIDLEKMKHEVFKAGKVIGVVHWHRDIYGGTLQMEGHWYPIPHGGDRDSVEHLVRRAFGRSTLRNEMENLRRQVGDLRRLQEERASCCDHKRHMDLTMPGGLIQQAENARDKQRFVCAVKIGAMTGRSMSEIRDLIGGY